MILAMLAAVLLGIPVARGLAESEEIQVTEIEFSRRAVVIAGGLNTDNGTNLEHAHARITEFLATTPDHVDIVINSPGGLLTPASEVLLAHLDYLIDRGVRVRCLVTGMAASLAAILLSHCSERYATGMAVIMVHAARITGTFSMNEFLALEIYTMLKELDDKLWAPLKALIDDSDYWDVNFKSERLIPAVEIADLYPRVLTVVSRVMVVP